MKHGYTIKRQSEQLGLGYLTLTLATDGAFYLATNNPRVCHTLNEARITYFTEAFKTYEKGTDFTYIEGPRKGIHRVGSRYSI